MLNLKVSNVFISLFQFSCLNAISNYLKLIKCWWKFNHSLHIFQAKISMTHHESVFIYHFTTHSNIPTWIFTVVIWLYWDNFCCSKRSSRLENNQFSSIFILWNNFGFALSVVFSRTLIFIYSFKHLNFLGFPYQGKPCYSLGNNSHLRSGIIHWLARDHLSFSLITGASTISNSSTFHC